MGGKNADGARCPGCGQIVRLEYGKGDGYTRRKFVWHNHPTQDGRCEGSLHYPGNAYSKERWVNCPCPRGKDGAVKHYKNCHKREPK